MFLLVLMRNLMYVLKDFGEKDKMPFSMCWLPTQTQNLNVTFNIWKDLHKTWKRIKETV